MRRLFVPVVMLVLLLLPLGGAQFYDFSYYYEHSFSSDAAVVTVQWDARQVQFRGAYIESTVATTVELERDGTAATATDDSDSIITLASGTPSTNIYSASNVGNGDTIVTYAIAANGSKAIRAAGLELHATGDNFTFRSDTEAAGTFRLFIWFAEYQ